MSDLTQSLAGILADAPDRLILSKQAAKTQEYRKVIIEKRTTATRLRDTQKNRYFTRTVMPVVWQTISKKRWAHSFYS